MFASWFVWFVLAVPPGENPQISSSAHRDAVARFGTAIWNLRRERLLTAAKQLEAAAKQDPDATAPRRELVRVYSQIGRESEAIRIAQASAGARPSRRRYRAPTRNVCFLMQGS